MSRRRLHVRLWLVVLASGAGAGASDPATRPAVGSGPAVATMPAGGPEAKPSPQEDELTRLQRFRQIIENTEDSLGTRRGQAEQLLRTGCSAATDIAMELLGSTSAPSTRVAVCEAIAALGVEDPRVLGEHHPRLIDPLLHLLGDANAEVSSKAAVAVAAYADGDVARRLGSIAADTGAPLDRRLAAVDALALNMHQRDVVRQFITLLHGENALLRPRVLASLRSACRQDFGEDIAAWQAWWQHEEETLTDAGWMADRASFYYRRLSETERKLDQWREEARRQHEVLVSRISDTLRDVYRLVPPSAQREETFVRWLSDPLIEFRLAGATLIREKIEDGTLPSEATVTALLGALSDKSPEMRRAVLGILGALNVPAHADAVLALLAEEHDPSVRETALQVLGQLRNPGAIETLIAEIRSPAAGAGCVAEAANALRILGAKGRVEPDVIAPAVSVLKSRLAGTPPSESRLREALLRAMASIGSPDFREDFHAALDTDRPQILVGAIQGISTLGDTDGLDRLVSLIGHADARVREAAVEAVGALGSEPAHLEALSGRLSATAEPIDSVRNAAWKALRGILGRKTPAVRLQWADRLRDVPDREVAYLDELIKELATLNPPPAELNAARRRLAGLYVDRDDLPAALTVWQQLFAALAAANDPQAREVGMTVISVALAAGRPDVVAETMSKLASAPSDLKERVVRLVREYVELRTTGDQAPRLVPLLDALLALPTPAYGAEFRAYLEAVRRSIQESLSTRPAGNGP